MLNAKNWSTQMRIGGQVTCKRTVVLNAISQVNQMVEAKKKRSAPAHAFAEVTPDAYAERLQRTLVLSDRN
jgi:hypothetical protein